MNILELDSYNLADAVKFNDTLNPKIWDKQTMRPEVREKLLAIAEDFKEFLGLEDIDVKDITVSGSNANYSYTPYSDIDLHLVVDIPQADSNEVYRELFDAKKYQYNDLHDYKIGGYDVELYVENANKPPVSKGVYSVLNGDWINIPRKMRSEVNDDAVRSKYEDLKHRINNAIASKDSTVIDRLARKIKDLRQAGLDAHGELGPENLAYKMLRKQGKIQQLYDARNLAKDKELSLREKAPATKVTYGFKTPRVAEDVGMSWDGVSPTTKMFLSEQEPTDEEILKNFIEFCVKELKIEQMPQVKLRRDPQWSVVNRTFGRYIDDKKTLEVAFGQRHIMDVLRTVAHELTHKHQHERDGSRMGPDAGETGSPYENEANARAGILMRDYGRLHPELFDAGQAHGLHADEVMESPETFRNKIRNALWYAYQQDPLMPPASHEHQPEDMDQDEYEDFEEHVDELLKFAVKNNITNANLVVAKWDQLAGPYDAVHESASGYIPTKKQAKDPRWSMALTQDIRPGQLGKEANKLRLKTDKQGHPQVAKANGLFEKLALEFAKFKKTDEDYSPDAPPGPETKPTMPKGTLRVDVSDMYDWYKLGKNISNLRAADKSQFGKGPPSTIVSFGDEDTEHQFIKDLEATGLDVTDIDPKDPKKRPGKTIKTDPTYNVNESQLNEVSMRPSTLKQFAASEEAKGIQAGFEAELIFRDTLNDGDGGDMEADYDADERVTSIQGIIDFFNNGEYGGLSQRQESRLQDSLDQAYFEWQDEQMYDAFRDEADDLVRDVWLEERPMAERIHDALVDGIGVTDREADEIVNLHDLRGKGEIKGSEMSEEQLDMVSQYSEAKSIAEDVLSEDVQTSIDNQDGYYDQALDEFRDGFYVDDDSGFFSDLGLRWMSDVANEYNLDWPYLTGGDNGGSRDWENIADSLNQVIDMPVKVSSGYHSATRKPGLWIVEPDSSLDPDDREDYGLEIVSPPMPLEQALEKLKQVVDWANSDEGNAYTNESTGLHMGVSVPFKGGDVDYLKLILFLGDEYVLQQYGREANTYTKAAMREIQQRARTEKNATGVLELLKNNLIELAQRELAKNTGEGKYTSAHKQGKYIEFRSAGGDWLANTDLNEAVGAPQGLDKLQNTMMRYAYAMYLASRPDLERREYAKKLYKLVAPEGNDSTMALFSQYAAGELDKDQLKKRWAEKTLSREDPAAVAKGEWVVIDKSTNKPVQGQSYNGYTKDEVRARAKQKLSPASSDTDFDLAYSVEPQNTGRWEVYRDDQGKDEQLEIIDAANRGEAIDRAYDTYTNVIPYKVRPYYGDQPATPEKALSPRAKLAKRIVKPKQVDYNYEIVEKSTGQTVEKLYGKNRDDAYETFVNWARDQEREPFDFELRQIQQQGAVQDVEPNVAQNFSTNPNPTAPIADQVRMPNGVPVWELFDVDTGSVLHAIADHTGREAYNQGMTWLRSVGAENPETYGQRFAIRPKRLAAGERNLSAPVDATEIPRNWEYVDRITGRVVDTVSNASYNQANTVQADIERRYPNADIYLRSVANLEENFADGKGPGRPGDSQRHGIPKGATIAQLEKAAKAPGRKGQLARWQLNMRRGKKK